MRLFSLKVTKTRDLIRGAVRRIRLMFTFTNHQWDPIQALGREAHDVAVSPMLPLVSPGCERAELMLMAIPERHRFGHGMSAPASGTQMPLIHDHQPRAVSSVQAGPATARRVER